jgi:acetylglutamate kinase
MLEAQKKARVLIEALPYIQRFAGEVFVIKIGGSAMKDEQALDSTLTDIVFLDRVGIRPVIVHGGGADISKIMESRALKPRFIRGRRYTDKETLQIVEEVLIGTVNKAVVEKLRSQGSDAVGVHRNSHDVLFARRYAEVDENGDSIDFGFVGKVEKVHPEPIEELCRQGKVPVIAPLAEGDEGTTLNCNADDAASKVAEALKAQKLVYLSDVPGICREVGNEASLASSLSRKEVRELIDKGVVSGGMQPKALECVQAIEAGVKKAHIIDGRLKHSLLLEIFTTEGIGTEIVP